MSANALANDIKSPDIVPLYKNSKFLLFVFTFLASSFSVAFFMFTVNWYVVDYLGMEAMLGLVLFASSVPRIAFMIIGGVIADRMNKAWIMFISDFVKGLLLIGVIVLLLFDLLSIWTLVIMGLIFGVLDAFFWPASSSMIPTILNKEQLTRGNSVIDTARSVSVVTGPLLAGVIIGFGNYTIMFAIVSGLLIVSAIVDLILQRKIERDAKPKTAANEKGESILSSIKAGFAYLKNSPFILSLMITSLFLNFVLSGPLSIGMPIFAKNILGGDEITYSFLSASFAGGLLIGTIIVGMLNIKKKRGLVAVSAIGAMAIFFTIFSLVSSLWINVVFVILIGVAASFTNVPLASAIQHHTADEYIGRIMSLIQFSAMGLIPISYLMTTMFISFGFGIDDIMFASALLLCAVSAIALIKAKPLRQLD